MRGLRRCGVFLGGHAVSAGLAALGLTSLIVSVVPPTAAKDAQMSAVDRLVAIEDIKQLKARYFRCLDQKDWDCWRAVFASDFIDGTRKEGMDGMFRHLHENGLYDRVKSVHHGEMPEITILSPTTARGIWAGGSEIFFPLGQHFETTGKEAVEQGKSHHFYTFYYETYVKQDGQWKIHTMDDWSHVLLVDDHGGLTIPSPPAAK
jgi:SnoaL-like protein